jgi:hypothetical protein
VLIAGANLGLFDVVAGLGSSLEYRGAEDLHGSAGFRLLGYDGALLGCAILRDLVIRQHRRGEASDK